MRAILKQKISYEVCLVGDNEEMQALLDYLRVARDRFRDTFHADRPGHRAAEQAIEALNKSLQSARPL